MRTSARLLILTVVLVVALLSAVARGHNGEPRPGPRSKTPSKNPADLRNIKPPPRFSWLHWWEANRDRFLVAPSQADAMQPAEAEQLKGLRDEASGELLKAIESNSRASLTIEAAMALGKMRHEPALPVLVTLATKSDRPDVRRAAMVALGLLGSPAAEKELLQLNPRRDERVNAIAAVGLLPTIQDTTLRQLRSMVTADAKAESADKVGASSVITWALRHHQKDDNLEYFRGLLAVNLSPWVASEALLGLGGTHDHAAQRILEETLFGGAVSNVRALDNLIALRENKRLLLGKGAANPERDEEAGRDLDESRQLEAGPEVVAMGWLRSSAAIALGELDAPRAREALLQFLNEDHVRYPSLVTPKEFAIMSLAAHPSDATRDRLIGLLGKQDERGKMQLDVTRDSPLRGFAALALGLYARPYPTEQGPADRSRYEWAVATLVERLDDDREEEEVRTACAVALGLTQRSDVLPALQKASARLDQRNRRPDQALLGFVMLGRALAGEKELVESAGKLLLGRPDDPTASGILSRRAAVLALGLTRSSTAVPVLTKGWHLNHYVNREVILALRLVGGSNAANPLMERLRQSKDAEERAYMAQALGELLAIERPTALSRLTAGSNYTVRNDPFLPLQSLANDFLFDYLIAALGEDW